MLEVSVRALTELDRPQVEQLDDITGLGVSDWLYGENNCWGAFSGDKLIAYCTFGYADDCPSEIENYAGWNSDCLVLSNVFVSKEYRYQGVASRMVKDAIDMHPESDHNLVFVTLINRTLASLYIKLGFMNMDTEDYAMVKHVNKRQEVY